ncbi:glycosylated lysosomal membrane protein [Empidonax traillii]|uniref:glycosylated lysosomal membrane protein n=1 Tax=Empidonax traillii TaxID=164674 RepID=UPI000FFDAD2E|nr:glycosylated lysosomal membrane protein [Empidonax traillii]
MSPQVTAFPSWGRAGVPPGLQQVPGSCGLEFLLQGVSPRGNSSRFLLEVAALEAPGAARALRARRDLDDEFAPGVFEVMGSGADSSPSHPPRSVLVGFGEPPRDTFSPLIISIMAVALGTPLALLLGGSGLVLLARRRRYSEYEPIN